MFLELPVATPVFGAWPMLAACAALFLLRDYDTLTLSRQPVPATA
ncbi:MULTISPECIES: hypothetical protein [Marinobacter]|jgi:hypothetical protein|nr:MULTISPECIES: hypothetical protein [Marinobacter]ERS86561.1 hypothetical protein Q667_16090 [Marinobacter sp. C1S70]